MVKQVNFTLDDPDHEKLKEAKGKQSWRDFIMTLVKP
jgi:predicted CopG family antitoxin